ncbi:hypothetical protein AYO21_03064 [Fonsecaea monophora]|uniref:SnoaL-like domain-containing protein n=1 Tax=Fonsecaea monophora TaxID=254056 RepID=A0A177FGD2_9EURO|nr:hypothetical protein AYO21_03064 [Fonsecaea monophora]KAH0840427.1 hypothetical protein FOPE_06033 [Fonsecaea pedrosoi]OAG42781.1 hypothetical protein AYO21_03064 [Fonsecaea monophora]
MSSFRDKLLATTDRFIRVMSGGTVDEVVSIRSANCVQRTLPSSLKAPSMNNKEFAAFYSSVSGDLSDFQVWLAPGTEPIVDETSRRVALHLHSRANGKNGTYSNEYIFLLLMSEDGSLLEEVVEFTDSAYVQSYFQPKE